MIVLEYRRVGPEENSAWVDNGKTTVGVSCPNPLIVLSEAQAMKAIRKFNKSSFGGGLKAMEKGYVGDGYDHLVAHMRHWVNKKGDKVKPKERARFEALQEERKSADEKGRKAFEELTKPKLASFK